jgi:hypothetical protein
MENLIAQKLRSLYEMLLEANNEEFFNLDDAIGLTAEALALADGDLSTFAEE